MTELNNGRACYKWVRLPIRSIILWQDEIRPFWYSNIRECRLEARLGMVNLLWGYSLCLKITWLPVWWSTPKPIFERAFTTSMPETTGSLGTDFYQFFFYWRRNRFVVFFEALQIVPNRIPYVLQRFWPRLALGNASGQRWTLGYVDSIFILLDDNSVFQAAIISCSLFFINVLVRTVNIRIICAHPKLQF